MIVSIVVTLSLVEFFPLFPCLWREEVECGPGVSCLSVGSVMALCGFMSFHGIYCRLCGCTVIILGFYSRNSQNIRNGRNGRYGGV